MNSIKNSLIPISSLFFAITFLAIYSLSKQRIADDDLSLFVHMPVASGAIVPEFDPRQDEEWVEQQNKKE
jgi:fucose permease